MNEAILIMIVMLHTLFVLFVIVTPFIGNNYFLMMHAMVVPFMVFHWILNDNHCFLTLLETQVRYQLYGTMPDPNDCFMHRLVAPVYDFKKNNEAFSITLYAITAMLWLISAYKLYSNWKNGKLAKISDLFIVNAA